MFSAILNLGWRITIIILCLTILACNVSVEVDFFKEAKQVSSGFSSNKKKVTSKHTANIQKQANKHLAKWKDLMNQLAPNDTIIVGNPEAPLVLTKTLNGHNITELMDALLSFPQGVKMLAWSGIHLVGLAYISDPMWSRFQDIVEKRGLPRPPKIEPSFDMKLPNGHLIIMVREGWEDDPVTVLWEVDYTTTIRTFYDDKISVSMDVDSAFRRYLKDTQPELTSPEINIKLDILARLYGNLRSRRTLKLCEYQGLRIDSYYRRSKILPEEKMLHLDLRQSLDITFTNHWRDLYYYGSTLFGLQIPDDMNLGSDSGEQELENWIKSNVKIEEFIRNLYQIIPDDLNDAFAPLLQPDNPGYYNHLPFKTIWTNI